MLGQKMLEELQGRRVCVFHQHACLFLLGVLTPEIPRGLLRRDTAEMQPAGAVYSIAELPEKPAARDRKSRTALQRAREPLRFATAMTTAGATRPDPQGLRLSAAQPAPQSPAPPDQARPSSAHLPGAPRPDTCSALASVLQAAHPSLRPAGCCPVLKPGRDLFSGRHALAGGVHPRPEPAVPAQLVPCHRLLSEHRVQPRPGSAPSPRMRVPLPDRRPAPSLAGSAPRRPHLPEGPTLFCDVTREWDVCSTFTCPEAPA